MAGVVLPDQRLAVHARGTSDGADVPARKEVAAASGEVVLFDPPDGRLPNAAARLRRGCGYRLILPRFPHRERSPGSGIRLPAGENRGGLPACPLPSVRGHENTATMAPFRRRRRGASPAAPREPGHVHGLRVVVIGLGGDASRQAWATGARRLVPYRSAAVSRRRREGGPGRRRWRVPGWRVLVAGGAPGSGSGCGGRLFCVTA